MGDQKGEYYNKSIEQTYANFTTKQEGLSKTEVILRLKQYGYNELKEAKKINSIIIFLRQFKSLLVYILLAAVIISFFLKEYIDASVILGILIFNAIFGFIQEYRAEKSIAALKKLASLKAKVIRENTIHEIDARELVPGDIILLEEGDKIPADARVTESIHLKTQEAALTGESESIEKQINSIEKAIALGDQKNMVFAGTVITSGRGKAVVTATGMQTEIGKIAKLIEEAEELATPLQKSLDKIGKILGIGTILVCLLIFGLAVFKGEALLPAFLAAVALAVAAVPEGLPAVITITLAVGVQRMIKKNALIRKLPSVETLGCTTVICTDKTGTLTKNEMTVRQIYTNGKAIEVTGTGYKTEGDFFVHGQKIDPKEVSFILKIGALNNNAALDNEKVIGDPTEGCLLVSAAKGNMQREILQKQEPRIEEIVFDSKRKRMSTIHSVGKKTVMYTKGAPDLILHICTKILMNGKVRSITPKDKKAVLEANKNFSSCALRVLAFAYKELPKKRANYTEADESDLIFVGLQGMIDPPRQEAKEAILRCKNAGIRVIMITGDHEDTAKAIGAELGLGTRVMNGKELESRTNLDDIIEHIDIYARVNPEHKLKIVEALQKNGHVVAMTGDGVNDAPALKKADIGVAMGITGTDVSKEASAMVLTDDNFTSIVNAVEEGRGIYGNIKKYFGFLLSGNISEVLIVFIITLLGFPIPLIATQILLINLVTDGFPALALSVDPYEHEVMKQKPRKRHEKLYKGLAPYLVYYPITMTIAALSVFSYFYLYEQNLLKAQTMTFVLISIFELFQAFSCRSTIHPAHHVGLFKNPYLLLAVSASVLVLASVVYIPSLQPLFGTVALSWIEVGTIILISFSGYVVIELTKAVRVWRGVSF
ncbi:cation-translocating P-type ATPase [Candidatus Woesearchaeota archaeon]|nr:cation-translocating P-type ATPase [Candidatus Woesearchaeota archaeon]